MYLQKGCVIESIVVITNQNKFIFNSVIEVEVQWHVMKQSKKWTLVKDGDQYEDLKYYLTAKITKLW